MVWHVLQPTRIWYQLMILVDRDDLDGEKTYENNWNHNMSWPVIFDLSLSLSFSPSPSRRVQLSWRRVKNNRSMFDHHYPFFIIFQPTNLSFIVQPQSVAKPVEQPINGQSGSRGSAMVREKERPSKDSPELSGALLSVVDNITRLYPTNWMVSRLCLCFFDMSTVKATLFTCATLLGDAQILARWLQLSPDIVPPNSSPFPTCFVEDRVHCLLEVVRIGFSPGWPLRSLGSVGMDRRWGLHRPRFTGGRPLRLLLRRRSCCLWRLPHARWLAPHTTTGWAEMGGE